LYVSGSPICRLDVVLLVHLGELAVLLAIVDEDPGAQLCPPLVEEIDALLDALEGMDDLALEPDQDRHGVFVCAAANLVGLGLRAGNDAAAFLLGRLGQPALIDQEGRLLLGPRDDALSLLLRLVDDSLALGVDALGGAYLLGHGDTQLVDQAEGGVLVDDDVVRERELLAVGDQRLEALNQEDDVDRSGLRERGLGWRGLSHGQPSARRSGFSAAKVSVNVDFR
jgi:hypothetical protein